MSVGEEACYWCGEAVTDGEPHERRPFLGAEGSTVALAHRECAARSVVGSVGHQLGRCSCHGGTEEDPPEMTKRQAALAAFALFQEQYR